MISIGCGLRSRLGSARERERDELRPFALRGPSSNRAAILPHPAHRVVHRQDSASAARPVGPWPDARSPGSVRDAEPGGARDLAWSSVRTSGGSTGSRSARSNAAPSTTATRSAARLSPIAARATGDRESRIKAARFHAPETLEEFDLTFQRSAFDDLAHLQKRCASARASP